MMANALLNRSLIVNSCLFNQKWRQLCSSSALNSYRCLQKADDIQCKSPANRSLEYKLIKKEMARRMSLVFGQRSKEPAFELSLNHITSCGSINIRGCGHQLFTRNSFCSNILFRKCKQSPNSIRHFHRSYILCDDLKVVVVPQLAESLSEGDIRWEKAIGDSVSEDEVLGEVETDKTSVPIHSPVAGVIEELLVEDGSTVQPGKAIMKIRVGAGGAPKKAEAPKPEASAPKPEAAAPKPAEVPQSPPPTPPRPSAPVSSTPTASIKPTSLGSEPGSGVSVGARKENRVKMNRMRQRIAQRLKDAQNTYAMLTTFNEIDMSNIIEMRNTHKDTFQKKHNLKLGFMSAFVKASAYALIDQPVVNAVIDDQEVVYRDYVDISVAVATPKGLVVPVIRNVENMSYADIEKAINALGEKARNNALAIEDMDGGTFTISNGGVFGSMFGTPIINPPQSAILGMHAIIERPVVINHKIEIRPMMYVCLTYDHRLIDGREAVTFLRKIKAAVEDPRIMFLEI